MKFKILILDAEFSALESIYSTFLKNSFAVSIEIPYLSLNYFMLSITSLTIFIRTVLKPFSINSTISVNSESVSID